MIPPTEQAYALLHATTWDLAGKYCNGDHEELLSCLTATRADLKQCIEERGFPESWWRFEAGTYDGLYTVEKDGVWVVYFQERGRIDYQYPQTFTTKAEAVDFVLDEVYLKKR